MACFNSQHIRGWGSMWQLGCGLWAELGLTIQGAGVWDSRTHARAEQKIVVAL